MAQWLADIDDIVELKVTLRALALLSETPARGPVPPGISLHELLDDPFLEAGIDGTAIRQGLASAIARRTLLAVQSGGEVRVFLNDEGCRRYVGDRRRHGVDRRRPDRKSGRQCVGTVAATADNRRAPC